MPLRDHFHPPLSKERRWESLHSIWINAISERLNETLPKDYFAQPEVHAGRSIEIDAGTFGESERGTANGDQHGPSGNGLAVAVLPEVYAPPVLMTVETAFADDFEVRVIREFGGLKLVAAIEFVSPGNKDRPEARRAFATKCASYLHNSVAVIVIDIVTERLANLHDEILPLATSTHVTEMGEGALYGVAYRPILATTCAEIDVWPHRLAVGGPLPKLPLWLNAVLAVPIDLEMTYATALRRARIE